ncbi:MAG: hypothetical protein ACT4OV_07935 [Microthrixaceae bacterium]
MSKWRVVLVGAMATGALAAGSIVPAFAEPNPVLDTPIGHLHSNGSSNLTAEGAEGNPDPFDGYLRLDASGVCTGDNNGIDNANGAEECNEAIITGQLPPS